jgi:hypothetical protein
MAQLKARTDPARPVFPWYAYMDFKSAKMERGEDGCLYVKDVIGTSEAEDRDGEVVDYLSVKAAMDDFMNRTGHGTGPLRRQHMGDAGGRVIAWRGDDDKKQIKIDLKIIGQETIELVENGGYTGVSIAFRRAYKEGNKLYVKRIGEWALVDNESNPDSSLPIAKAEADTDRKGLGLVQWFVGILANLIAVREQVKFEKGAEGDQSELPEKADALARSAAEMARDMFEEEVAEALGDMDEDEVSAGSKAMSELVGTVSSKAGKLGAAAQDLKGAVMMARDSYDTAAKRRKEAPVTKAEQDAKAAQAILDALIETDMKAGKDGTAGMSAHHQAHAKALHGLHSDMTEHHKAFGEHLDTHAKAMHPDVHKAFTGVHKAMGATLKAHAAHAASAGKMVGGKKDVTIEATDLKALDVDGVQKLIDAGIATAIATVMKDKDETIKALSEQVTKLGAEPAAHPLQDPAAIVPVPPDGGPGEGGPMTLKRLAIMGREDPRFGEQVFGLAYSQALAKARGMKAAPASKGG